MRSLSWGEPPLLAGAGPGLAAPPRAVIGARWVGAATGRRRSGSACDLARTAAFVRCRGGSPGGTVAAMPNHTRRDVLRGGLAAAALGVVHASCGSTEPRPAPAKSPPEPKRILILGGTGFLGPKTIAAAVARGHHVTIFNRGKREKVLPLEIKVEHLYG